MRKAVFLLVVVNLSMISFGQVGTWNASVSIGYVIGGPSQAIKYKMEKEGYDANVENWLFGGYTQYPKAYKDPAIMARVYYRKSLNTSLFLEVGQTMNTEVKGYKGGGGYGGFAGIKYQVLQLAAGIQRHFNQKPSSIGIAASLNLLQYGGGAPYDDVSENKFLPGLLISGRLPMGPQKKLIGLDLVYDLNILPSVEMEPVSSNYFLSYETGKVNMIHGSIGLALAFHAK